VPKPPAPEKPRLDDSTPPTTQLASSTQWPRSGWANGATLQDHFNRHGKDFGAKSAKDYVKKSIDARDAKVPGRVWVQDTNTKDMKFFDPDGSFGSYQQDGQTKTYFRAGKNYLSSELSRPGRIIVGPSVMGPGKMMEGEDE
jgi:pyocin large subunit-like protein